MTRRVCLVLLLVLVFTWPAAAYGVLAHEAVIDATWDKTIVPVLRARFHPTDDELKQARAYAYGGSLIQDIGYYPFSSRQFGDLTHYVRAGDFVAALLADASNVNEYAFALGALAHYAGDNEGHRLAINPSVALIYPKLRAKYGNQVTYEQNPAAHLKTEFAFDVIQVARGSYAPTSYHDFIGFEVSKPVLEKAFRETYGLELSELFGDLDRSVGTFRYAVNTMVPQMVKVAWDAKHDEIIKLSPGVTREQFMFRLTRPQYEHEWGIKYDRPGFGTKLLGVILRIIPKIGPFQALAFHMPTPQAERLFVDSFTSVVARYRTLVEQAADRRVALQDLNFDTAKPVVAGDYRRADEACEKLLAALQKDHFAHVPPPLQAHLVAFFAKYPTGSAKDRKHWQQVRIALDQLARSRNPGQAGTARPARSDSAHR